MQKALQMMKSTATTATAATATTTLTLHEALKNNTLQHVRNHIVPQLTSSLHKGQLGRIGVAGRCYAFCYIYIYSS